MDPVLLLAALQGCAGKDGPRAETQLQLDTRGETGAPAESAAPPDTGAPSDTPPPEETASPSDTGEAPIDAPALYPDDRIQSPVTPWVADTWRSIVEGSGGQADVFMKVGDSHTDSRSTFYCFADPDQTDLGSHAALSDTLAFFRGGDAAGATPFDRDSEAALSGMSTGWVLSGDPSPLEVEIAAIDPRYAVVHYGSNDMEQGTTHDSAMPGFYVAMMDLLDLLEGQGILAILTAIPARLDLASAGEWVETYNALIRGMAQARQLPFVDLHLATWDLEGHGLSGDGLHLEAYTGGACVLTEEGLEHGYNVRNLIGLEALDRVRDAVIEGAPAPDAAASALTGEGSPTAPFEIASLPFSDTRDTRDSPHARLDEYTGCDYDADESGPEWLYTLTLSEPTPIRALVLDREGVDVDLHLLGEGGGVEDCVLRSDRTLETTLEAGTWIFALDTYVSGGDPLGGEYLFVVQPCEAGDADCDR